MKESHLGRVEIAPAGTRIWAFFIDLFVLFVGLFTLVLILSLAGPAEGKGYLTADDIPSTHRVEVRRGPVNQGGPAGLFDLYGAPTTRAEVQRAQRLGLLV